MDKSWMDLVEYNILSNLFGSDLTRQANGVLLERKHLDQGRMQFSSNN